jgi:hypothetical protein
MAYDKEAIQYAKRERRYREEVHGCNLPRDCSRGMSASIWRDLEFSGFAEAIARQWLPTDAKPSFSSSP